MVENSRFDFIILNLYNYKACVKKHIVNTRIGIQMPRKKLLFVPATAEGEKSKDENDIPAKKKAKKERTWF